MYRKISLDHSYSFNRKITRLTKPSVTLCEIIIDTVRDVPWKQENRQRISREVVSAVELKIEWLAPSLGIDVICHRICYWEMEITFLTRPWVRRKIGFRSWRVSMWSCVPEARSLYRKALLVSPDDFDTAKIDTGICLVVYYKWNWSFEKED